MEQHGGACVMEQHTLVTIRLFLISQLGVVVASLAYKSLAFIPGAALGIGFSSFYEFKCGAFSSPLRIVLFALWLFLVFPNIQAIEDRSLTILVESGGGFSTAAAANEINVGN